MKFRKFNGYCQYNAGSGWRFTHRTVARKSLGKSIPNGFHVHHRNGVKTDNRPGNLTVLPAKVHKKIHSR